LSAEDARIERLDDLLIYCTGLGALIPYVLQALLGEFLTAIGALPVLLFALIAPVYVGLYRGAIKMNVVEERVRGWIYLVPGMFTGPASLVLSWLRDAGYLTDLLTQALFFAVVAVVSAFSSFFIGKRLYKLLCNILGINITQKSSEVYNMIASTAMSSAALSLYFSCVSLVIIQILSSKSILESLILLALASAFLLPLAIKYVQKARKCVEQLLRR